MKDDLKKAQELLNVDFKEIVDAILEDNNFEPINRYIRQLKRHEDEMWSWSSLTKFEARHLYEQYMTFRDSAEFHAKLRKVFERSIWERLGKSADTVIIVGSKMSIEATLAEEIFEEWELEDALHDIAEIVSDDLNERIMVAQDIVEAIEEYQEQFGTQYDDDILFYVCDLMFDEIDRVNDMHAMLVYEERATQMAQVRKKFRMTRRKIASGEYDTYTT